MLSQNEKSELSNTTAVNSSLFCYEVNNNRILIEPEIKMEILESANIYPVPNSPAWYLGVTSLRGDILAIINMHFLLKSRADNIRKRLLKLDHPNFPPLILAIDSLPYQVDIRNFESTNKVNKGIYPPWVGESAKQGENTFLHLDHSLLFKSIQDNSIKQLLN